MISTVKEGILTGITGYDIHYAHITGHWDGNAKAQMTAFKNRVVELINQFIVQGYHCYIRDIDQYDRPAGPWPGAMFEIEIGTTAKESAEFSYDAELVQTVDRVMRAVIEQAVEYHQKYKLPGTLIVHPNKGSKNSDYAFERKGLYELSWHVIGPPIPFIDIWEAPGGLTHARAMIQQERSSGGTDEAIKAKLQKWVQPNGNPYSERLIEKLLKEVIVLELLTHEGTSSPLTPAS